MYDIPEETEWYFHTLSNVSTEIGNAWFVLMRIDEQDMAEVRWYIIPQEDRPIDEYADLSFAETHPERVTIKLRGGILFATHTKAPRSIWMHMQLRNQPELAGRII